MRHGHFLWADLSAYEPEAARRFYTDLLDWKCTDYTCFLNNKPVAGIFAMPDKFRAIKMPAFWMSYIGVRDINVAIETAREAGGKVELGPEEFPGGGAYALIRDPLGAGFTVYQGDALDGPATIGPGHRAGHGLFVSDASAVIPFYSALFGWEFTKAPDGVFEAGDGTRTLFHLHEIPDPAIRGKEQYWAVFFATPDLQTSIKQLEASGGSRVATLDLPEGKAELARDGDGAAFFLLEQPGTGTAGTFPWAGWAGFGLMWASILTGWGVLWAIFLVFWIGTGLRDRATWLFGSIARDRDPVLYWMVLASFAVLAALSLAGFQ